MRSCSTSTLEVSRLMIRAACASMITATTRWHTSAVANTAPTHTREVNNRGAGCVSVLASGQPLSLVADTLQLVRRQSRREIYSSAPTPATGSWGSSPSWHRLPTPGHLRHTLPGRPSGGAPQSIPEWSGPRTSGASRLVGANSVPAAFAAARWSAAAHRRAWHQPVKWLVAMAPYVSPSAM